MASAAGKGGYSSNTSGGSTPKCRSDKDNESDQSSGNSSQNHQRKMSNPKMWTHSTSAIGLDEMIEDRREGGDLRQNVVHIEVPFGKPIEEVYEGVHTGPVLGSGASGLVRIVTHKVTGIKYAVKVLDLCLVDTSEGLRQLREEISIMCQVCNSEGYFEGVLARSKPAIAHKLPRHFIVGSPEHCSPRGSLRESIGNLSRSGTLLRWRTL
jgi:hypothetical protein